MPMARSIDASGELGRRVKEAVELQREFRGYVWSQWFRQNLTQVGTLLRGPARKRRPAVANVRRRAVHAVAAGDAAASCWRPERPRAWRNFSRSRCVPSLLIPLLSPAIGQSYGVVDALVHGLCLFVVGAVFFSLAFLLSTVFDDLWRPLLIACAVAVVVGVVELAAGDLAWFGPFHVMSAESYFRSGSIPWTGLIATSMVTAGMLYAATVSIAQRDF